jgi:hypothetical protein
MFPTCERDGERTAPGIRSKKERAMEGATIEPSPRFLATYRKGRWLLCAFPPLVFIALEETPGVSGLDGINAAGLIVLSPVFFAAGFGLTAAIVLLTRWIGRRAHFHSRIALSGLMLTMVGLLSPLAYLDRDWLQLAAIELASLPAALILVPVDATRRVPRTS